MYKMYDKHLSRGTIKCVGEFDTYDEAHRELERWFILDLERYDDRKLGSQADIQLNDGRIVNWYEFYEMDDVEDYRYILNSDSYEFDSHRYYIDEESK